MNKITIALLGLASLLAPLLASGHPLVAQQTVDWAPVITVTNPNPGIALSKTYSARDDHDDVSDPTTWRYFFDLDPGCLDENVETEVFPYTEGDPVVLAATGDMLGISYYGLHVCFRSEDAAGNVGRAASQRITDIRLPAPVVTVVSPAGGAARSKVVSAHDDYTPSSHQGPAVMHYLIQQSDSCADAVPSGARPYQEREPIMLSDPGFNGQYVCFWSVNAVGTVGRAVSNRISGISATAPVDGTAPVIAITLEPSNIPGDKAYRAVDDHDDRTDPTVWYYTLQSASVCPSERINVLPYDEGDLVLVGDSGLNGFHICFWSVDGSNNVGKKSFQITGFEDVAPVITVLNPNIGRARAKVYRAIDDHDDATEQTDWSYEIADADRCPLEVSLDTKRYTEGEPVVVSDPALNGKYVCFRVFDTSGNHASTVSERISGIDPNSNVPVLPVPVQIWQSHTVLRSGTSAGSMSRALGLGAGQNLYSWDANHQRWVKAAISGAGADSFAAGTSIIFRGAAVDEAALAAAGLGRLDTLTLSPGWNIFKPAEAALGLTNWNFTKVEGGGSSVFFAQGLTDCASTSGVLVVYTFDHTDLKSRNGFRLALPCHPQILRDSGYPEVAFIDQNDIVYVYFNNAASVKLRWSGDEYWLDE